MDRLERNDRTTSSCPQCSPARGSRRSFLTDVGLGFTGMVMGAMLFRDGFVRGQEPSPHAIPNGEPHFAPRARSVIWIFLSGGYSHLETFDPKPDLNRFAGKTYQDTGYPSPFDSPLFQARSRAVVGGDRLHSKIMPLQVGHRPRGESGIEVADWLPHLGDCVDDLAIVRSMYTTDNDHNAEFQMHHGRHKLDEKQPVIGSWIHYGLGTVNENLPEFVFLGQYKDPRVKENFDANYIGPEYSGVELSLDGPQPLPFGAPPAGVLPDEQRQQFELVRSLNELAAKRHPDDERIRARVKAYELAFRMQMSAPEALDMSQETAETQQLYGIDQPTTAVYGRRLLAARRLAERGVRYTLCYLSDYGEWDSHTDLKQNHARSCERIDKPVAGLLKDLKRRGLWDDVLVVFCTEFGRTPAVEIRGENSPASGRDHHPHAFSIWLAGAGVKGGCVHGHTDELGFHAIESPHYVTDLHATVLHLLGLDPRRLDIPGRKRLEIDYGTPIHDIMRT